MRDGKMHHSNFFCFQTPTPRYSQQTFLGQTQVENQQTIIDLRTNHACDVAKYSMVCQRIFYHITEYFAMSLNDFHVVDKYITNIP
jgi:hypothetical protein